MNDSSKWFKKLPNELVVETVIEEAPKILGKWNPTIYKDSDYGCCINTDNSRIHIGCNRNYLGTTLKSPTETAIYEDIELDSVLEALFPELPDTVTKPRYLFANYVIPSEVTRHLNLIAGYCYPLLDGDKNAWLSFENWKITRGGRMRTPGQTIEDHLRELKQQAEIACSRRKFWTAFEFYTEYKDAGGRMTLKDRWHLYLLSRHTFLLR